MQPCPTLASLVLWHVPSTKLAPPSASAAYVVVGLGTRLVDVGCGATLNPSLYDTIRLLSKHNSILNQLACVLSEEIPALTCACP